MVKKLDISNWNRRLQYEHFREFSDPFFNITAQVDITGLVDKSKEIHFSFFSLAFFVVLKAVNEIEELRLRIRGKDVIIHDVIHGSCTVLNDDESFSFCYFDYVEEYSVFAQHVEEVISANRLNKSLDPMFERDDIIHSSVIPWVSFTGFEHAKRHGIEDSVPKIILGKFFEDGARVMMPISLAAHHALVDGIHAGKFFHLFEKYAGPPSGIPL